MRTIFQALGVGLGVLLGACATTPATPSAEAVRSLAPQGVLHVAINLGNQVLAQRKPDGQVTGVSVVLATELGKRLNVPVQMTVYEAAGKVFEALDAGAWDVAFLANEPERAQKIVFSPPYAFIDGAYLVRKDSPIQTPADADRAGVRIAVGRGAAYDLVLSRTLKNAELVRFTTGNEAIAMFQRDRLDAAAGVRQALMDAASAAPDLRVLEGSFTRIEQAVAVPRGRDAGATYVAQFLEEMKASGAVRRALDATGQSGATVAPPAR